MLPNKGMAIYTNLRRIYGNSLLQGTASLTVDGVTLDIGSTQLSDLGETVVGSDTYTLADLTTGGALNLENGNIDAAFKALDTAITQITMQRGSIGAFQKNTLGSLLSTKKVAIENISDDAILLIEEIQANQMQLDSIMSSISRIASSTCTERTSASRTLRQC